MRRNYIIVAIIGWIAYGMVKYEANKEQKIMDRISQIDEKYSDKWDSLKRDINKHIIDTEDFKELVKDDIIELINNRERLKQELEQLINETIELRIKDRDKQFNETLNEKFNKTFIDEVHKRLNILEKKCESLASYMLRKLGITDFLNDWLPSAEEKKSE